MTKAVHPAPTAHHGARWRSQAVLETLAGGALVAMAFVALAVSDASAEGTRPFWSLVVLIYGLVSVLLDCLDRTAPVPLWRRSSKTALHWVGVFVALHLVYFFVGTGRMANADTALTSALILALGAFTSGVHGNWRFMVIGTALALATVTAAWIEQYLWILAGLGVSAVVILLAGTTRRAARREGTPA